MNEKEKNEFVEEVEEVITEADEAVESVSKIVAIVKKWLAAIMDAGTRFINFIKKIFRKG